MGKGAAKSDGPERLVRIQGQSLREALVGPDQGPATGFIKPDDAPTSAPMPMARWRQADLKRAIAAAEEAGLHSYRVEISPEGTISILVGASPAASEG